MTKIKIGMKVKTLKAVLTPEQEKREYLGDSRRNVQWGVIGEVINVSNSHGLTFEVKLFDNTSAWYEPSEISL